MLYLLRGTALSTYDMTGPLVSLVDYSAASGGGIRYSKYSAALNAANTLSDLYHGNDGRTMENRWYGYDTASSVWRYWSWNTTLDRKLRLSYSGFQNVLEFAGSAATMSSVTINTYNGRHYFALGGYQYYYGAEATPRVKILSEWAPTLDNYHGAVMSGIAASGSYCAFGEISASSSLTYNPFAVWVKTGSSTSRIGLYLTGTRLAGVHVPYPTYGLTVGGTGFFGDYVTGLGTELVTNGHFTSDPSGNWTYGTGWSWDGVTKMVRAQTTLSNLSQTLSVTVGKPYLVVILASDFVYGSFTITLGGTAATYKVSSYNGQYQFLVVPTTTGDLIITPDSTNTGASFDSISVKEITSGSVYVTDKLGVGTCAPSEKITVLGGSISIATATSNTAPIILPGNGSGILCTGLNADLLDGLHGNSWHYNHGIEARSQSTISLSTRTFTIAPTSSTFGLWVEGVRYAKESCQVTVDNTAGVHYIYFDSTGTLQKSMTSWDITSSNSPIAIVLWDGAQGCLLDERHGYDRNRPWHEWAHETIGSRYESGLVGTFTNTTFSVTEGYFHDEDIEHHITAQTSCRLWYRSSGAFTFTGDATSVYKLNGSNIQYDNGTNAVDAGSQKYVNHWVYASGDTAYPIYVVLGQAQWNTLSEAQGATPPTTGNLPISELKLLYSVTYKNTGNPPTYVETRDYRSSTGPAGTFVAVDHGSLSGLGDDDHPQYLNEVRGDLRYLKLDCSNDPLTSSLETSAAVSGDLYQGVLNTSTNAAATASFSLSCDGATPYFRAYSSTASGYFDAGDKIAKASATELFMAHHGVFLLNWAGAAEFSWVCGTATLSRDMYLGHGYLVLDANHASSDVFLGSWGDNLVLKPDYTNSSRGTPKIKIDLGEHGTFAQFYWVSDDKHRLVLNGDPVAYEATFIVNNIADQVNVRLNTVSSQTANVMEIGVNKAALSFISPDGYLAYNTTGTSFTPVAYIHFRADSGAANPASAIILEYDPAAGEYLPGLSLNKLTGSKTMVRFHGSVDASNRAIARIGLHDGSSYAEACYWDYTHSLYNLGNIILYSASAGEPKLSFNQDTTERAYILYDDKGASTDEFTYSAPMHYFVSTADKTNSPTLKVDSLLFQCYATDNIVIGANVWYAGGWKTLNTGFTSVINMNAGEVAFYIGQTSTSGGATADLVEALRLHTDMKAEFGGIVALDHLAEKTSSHEIVFDNHVRSLNNIFLTDDLADTRTAGRLELRGDATGDVTIYLHSDGNANPTLYMAAEGQVIMSLFYDYSTAFTHFYNASAGVYLLSIDPTSYRVGINVSQPSSTLDVNGDIEMVSTGAQYFGDPSTDGTYKVVRLDNDLVTYRRESGNYVEKHRITAA